MRIDAHQHFWHYEPARDTWITDEMGVLKRDYLAQELLPELRANGMDASVAVQAAQSEQETEFLLSFAAKHREIAGVVGWANLCAPDIADQLAKLRGREKLCGFRHIAQSEPDDRFLVRADFLRGVWLLGQHGFTYDILIYPKQLPAAIELAGRLPGQRFVLDHIAKPEIKNRRLEPWAAHIRELAGCPNVFCKLSGLVTEADWGGWKAEDFRPYLDVVFESFGTERLMFGSDWPVCLLAGSYKQVVELIAAYVERRPEKERAAIFGENAARFYEVRA